MKTDLIVCLALGMTVGSRIVSAGQEPHTSKPLKWKCRRCALLSALPPRVAANAKRSVA
jgi:hypothetical protein